MKVKEICEVMNCSFSIYAYDKMYIYPSNIRLCENGDECTFLQDEYLTPSEPRPVSRYLPKDKEWVFVQKLPTFEELMNMEVHSIISKDRDRGSNEIIVTVDIPLIDKDGGLIE